MSCSFFFSSLIFSTLACSLVHAAPTPKAPVAKIPVISPSEKLADAIQKYYNQTNSASFSFTQSSKHPFLPSNESSKGQVFFKARKMLWRYQEPATRKKEFYIADNKLTYYNLNEKTAYTHDCFKQDTLSASITFLWGKGKLKESFTISPYMPPAGQKSPLAWLTLTPKEANAPVKSIILGADPKNGIVKESIVTDPSNGSNHFVFSNIKTNIAIPDSTFTFKAPKGVHVQPMPNVVCPTEAAPAPKPTPTPAPVAPTKIPAKK